MPPAYVEEKMHKKGEEKNLLPLPQVAWSIFRWSTVICNISAFSSLADPWKERRKCVECLKANLH